MNILDIVNFINAFSTKLLSLLLLLIKKNKIFQNVPTRIYKKNLHIFG